MATPTYMIYNAELQSWDSQCYTLEELRNMPELSSDTHVCTADGKRTCTLGELTGASPAKKPFRPSLSNRDAVAFPAASPSKEREKAIDYLLEHTELARLIRNAADYIGLLHWLSVIVLLLGAAAFVLSFLK